MSTHDNPAQRGGEAVDREALAALIDPPAFAAPVEYKPPSVSGPGNDWRPRKDRAREAADRILAARGDAAPTVTAEQVAEAWHDATCLGGRGCWSRREHARVLLAYPDHQSRTFLANLGVKVVS